MYATLIYFVEYNQCSLICPFCDKNTEFSYMDYCQDNCWCRCSNCAAEFLICVGFEVNKDEIEDILWRHKCMQKLPSENAEYDKYTVGVLKITGLTSTEEESDEEEDEDQKEIVYEHTVDTLRLDTLSICTNHDGSNLYYKGICSECGTQFKSHIWDD